MVRVRSTDSPSGVAQLGQHRDEVRQRLPDERLAAGDPQLPDAELDEDPGQPADLLVGQDLRVRQEGVVAPEDLGRHAVRAAEVAAVRDRDPEVAQRPPSSIEDPRAPVEAWRSLDRSPRRSYPGAPERAPGAVGREGSGAVRWYLRAERPGTSSRAARAAPPEADDPTYARNPAGNAGPRLQGQDRWPRPTSAADSGSRGPPNRAPARPSMPRRRPPPIPRRSPRERPPQPRPLPRRPRCRKRRPTPVR